MVLTRRERSMRGMVRVPGGFLVDEHPVTTAEFRHFVRATGYVTCAERATKFDDRPGVDPIQLVPGSLVFTPTEGPTDLGDETRWWVYVPGASWRLPLGPGHAVTGVDRHPVVHVSFEDAASYAAWAGKALPTEAEWEHAACGGLDGATFPWGDAERLRGRRMANTWQGRFPWENLLLDGFERTSPIRSFPPNAYGLYDVVGNVWEWTTDAAPTADGTDGTDGKVVKGGSHLSPRVEPVTAVDYRPAARASRPVDRSMSDLGFRCVVP